MNEPYRITTQQANQTVDADETVDAFTFLTRDDEVGVVYIKSGRIVGVWVDY